mgnify:CR=1 FL=1
MLDGPARAGRHRQRHHLSRRACAAAPRPAAARIDPAGAGLALLAVVPLGAHRCRASSRAARGAVDPFIVMDVMAAAAEKEAAGETVIHLEVGQPSTPAPRAALAAAHAALDTDRIGYVAALGMPALRERIARHYREAYGVEVPPDRVIVTTGSSGGFPLAFLASFDAGDRVALAAPGYPAYRNILAALNLEAVDLPTSAADRFQPTVEALEERRADPRRADRRQPVQSHRHDGEPCRDEGAGRLVRPPTACG